MEDVTIGDLFKTPEQKEAEAKAAKEDKIVPKSFTSVEEATKWFNERDIFITSTFRDRSGQLHFEAERIYSSGQLDYWCIPIGKKKELGEPEEVIEETGEGNEPDSPLLES